MYSPLLLTPLLLLPALAPAALAQSMIIPAADGTGTLVLPDGSTYTITGGTRSGDGANLFHSFEQFGLTATEVANFLADPSVQNILGRVVGGNASMIDGLMQVSGSSANLYLINPAGILFGPNSALNLDGSFTATTASGIGFGDDWWPAVGDSNYEALVGNPTAFTFGSEPGALVNAGNLAVNPGEVITLASGSVIALGTLRAPGGEVIVMAVPGENLVSIRPAGSRLSLELAPLPEGVQPGDPLPFSPLDLPSLLRAGEPQVTTGITANDDGTVSLPGVAASLPTTPGAALVSGTVDVAGETGGTVQVLGDRIAVTAATIDASGRQGGGQVLIGGEYRGQGPLPTASRTYVDAQSTIRADAVENGDGGEVIVWAEEGTRFDGTITARGGATDGDGGFVEVSGRDTLAFNGQVDVSAANGAMGSLLLDPTNITISAAASSPGVEDLGGLPNILAADLPGDVTINSTTLENQVGNIILEASNNITIAPGLSLTFVPGGSITFTADADGDQVGDFTMDTAATIQALGRSLTITGAAVTAGNLDVNDSTAAAGDIRIVSSTGDLTVGNITTSADSAFPFAGDVTLSAPGGSVTTGDINAIGFIPGVFSGDGGSINLSAEHGIQTGNINALSGSTFGGSITLTSNSGSISTGDLSSLSFFGGGGRDITLSARNGSITTGTLEAYGNFTRVGGAITLSAAPSESITLRGNIATDNNSISLNGPVIVGGNITIGNRLTSGNITFSDTVTGNNPLSSLTVAAGAGDITFNNADGNISRLNNLTIETSGMAEFNSAIETFGALNLITDNPVVRAPLIGSGTLQIQPFTSTTPISLGGTGDLAVTFLNQAEINQLGNGFSSITIGNSVGTGNITLDGNVTFSDPTTLQTLGSIDTRGGTLSGIDDASLTLEANQIATGAVSTAGQPITLDGTLGGGSGPVFIDGPLTTNGGNIIISGADPVEQGVNVRAALNSGGGSITITGTSNGFDGQAGILLDSPITSGGGAVTLTGTGNTGSGIVLFDGSVNSGGGSITMAGTGGFGGILNVAPISSGGGDINLTGAGTFNSGISHSGSINSQGGNISLTTISEALFSGGTIAAQAGNILLTSDNPVLFGPITGTGTLTIRQTTPSLPISLGGSEFASLNQFELDQLGNDFSSRTIGQVGNTGAITLEPFTLTSPLTLNGGVITGPAQNTTWALDPDGSLAIGGFGAPLRLVNPTEVIGGEDVTNTVLGSAGNDTLTVIGDGTALFRNIRFSNINAFDGGGGFNTIAGTSGDDYFVVTGNTSGFTRNSDFLPDINFVNVGAIAAAGGQQDVVELAGVPLNMTVTGGSGTLFLASQGAVTLNADVTTPGNLVVSASQGDIAQVGGQVTVGGDTSLDAPGNIGLLGNNDFNTVSITAAQNVALRDRHNLQLNDLTFSGSLQAIAAGDLTATTNLGPGVSPTPLTLAADSVIAPLTADSIAADSTGGVNLTSGGNLTTADITAPGAPIFLDAAGAITTGNLNSRGGNGGAVTLQAGDRIQVNTINAQGASLGGAITAITPSTFQALGSFLDQNQVLASLSTVGGRRGDAITLGYGPFSFTLGDPGVNGTQAAITTGDVNLPPDPANPIVGSRIFGRGQPGEVQLISLGNVPRDPIIPTDTDSLQIEVPITPDLTDAISQDEDRPKLTSAGQALSEEQLALAEEDTNRDFANHFGNLIKPAREVSLEEAQATLQDIQAQTGEVPAILYVRFSRSGEDSGPRAKAGESELELLLIPPEGIPSRIQVLNAPRQMVIRTQEQLRRQITNPNLTHHAAYLPTAQRLYNWIIEPIKDELTAAGITNLGFILDGGLRTMPLAALHSGEQFLIEEFSLGLIPSLGLVDTTYVNLNRQSSSLVIGGTSQFINQPPLLAAGVEMTALQAFWPGSTKVADSGFTFEALQQSRRQAQIIHLATHAQFLRGAPEQSYLQFFDGRLRLNRVPDLGWFDPQVELVTLSACQTAMGNLEAELGFAGFALVAGAKSALASLWQVSDEATAGLMTTFYQQLDQQATKTEALRQAQLAMLRGDISTDGGQLLWPGGALPLPPELTWDRPQDLRHPFYWAAFTVVGSPW